jgi:hypothetical protein
VFRLTEASFMTSLIHQDAEEPLTRDEVPGPGNILGKILPSLPRGAPGQPETPVKKQARNYPIEAGKYLPDGLGSSNPLNNKPDL